MTEYWTAKEAIKLLEDSNNPQGLISDWWSEPEDFPKAPFQWCTISGNAETEDGSRASCFCLTEIKSEAYADSKSTEFPIWFEYIRRDPLIPYHTRDLLKLLSEKDYKMFSSMWDHLVDLQNMMRNGWVSLTDHSNVRIYIDG